MNFDVAGFISVFVGSCLLFFSLFVGIAPWDWLIQLSKQKNLNHGLCIVASLILFLLAIIVFRKFQFRDIFINNGQ